MSLKSCFKSNFFKRNLLYQKDILVGFAVFNLRFNKETMAIQTVITGTGSFIPANVISNADFSNHTFYDESSEPVRLPSATIAEKFKLITGIKERRYVDKNMTASSIGAMAAQKAILDAGIDAESIDQIIFAHNFGDISQGTNQSHMVPSLASRVKHLLGIKNPDCIPHDIIFGCPGWIQGVLHADTYFKAGAAKRALVIGAETLSRIVDKYDRDCMIFSDGAGACIVEAIEKQNLTEKGILSSSVKSYTVEEIEYLHHGKSNGADLIETTHYLKMKGRKVYDFALLHVPLVIKDCLGKAKLPLKAVKMFFLHQANEKMDTAIIEKLYQLYGENTVPDFVMPMSIQQLGNSSVATIPTLLDLVKHSKMENYLLQAGDIVVFASIGAGMNVNAFCYKM